MRTVFLRTKTKPPQTQKKEHASKMRASPEDPLLYQSTY